LLIPNTVWPIPENRNEAESSVSLGLRVTNTTKTAFRFNRYFVGIPDLVDPDGKTLEVVLQGSSLPVGRTVEDCLLVKPGESMRFMLDMNLRWAQNQQLRLFGGIRSFNPGWIVDLKPGPYKVRLRCRNGEKQFKTFDQSVLNDVWTGEVTTPFVEVTIARP